MKNPTPQNAAPSSILWSNLLSLHAGTWNSSERDNVWSSNLSLMQRWWSGDCDDPPPRLTSYETIVVVRMACEFVCILPRCVPISFIISALFSFIIICIVDWRFFWSIYRLVQRFSAQSKYESFQHRTTETYLGWRQRTNGALTEVELRYRWRHSSFIRIYIGSISFC